MNGSSGSHSLLDVGLLLVEGGYLQIASEHLRNSITGSFGSTAALRNRQQSGQKESLDTSAVSR